MREEEAHSYRQIAKSTGIFGGSQVLVIILGILRTKVLAVLLSTSGIGLAGLYQSAVDLVRSISGLGLSFSAVKDIAEANQSNDSKRIGGTVTMLRRWLLWTGVLGMILTIAFSSWISQYTFGDKEHIFPICLLSFSVLAGTLSSGQLALLQGMRQTKSMAKASLYGAFAGLIISVIFYTVLGEQGIVPALIAASLLGLFFSWYFARKVQIEKQIQTVRETWEKGRGMVLLGFYTVFSGLISTLTLFLIRTFILKTGGIEPVGLYQSVWSISNLYVGAILTAMSADYFPRLCGMNQNNEATVQFANEQTRFVLVIALPLIVFMLFVAPPVLSLLYSSSFTAATSLLRWQIAGTFLKILIWPMGFIILARGKGKQFLLVETTWFVVYYAMLRMGWPIWGINAAGIAYVVAYLFYIPLIIFLIRPLCSFHLTKRNRWLIVIFSTCILLELGVTITCTGWFSILAGAILLILSVALSAIELHRIIPFSLWKEKISKRFKR
jgi:O-antigen/teichoic acid export membrane protein